MRRILLGCIFLGLLAKGVSAETAVIEWIEPVVPAGTLAYTTMYWCLGTGCTNWTSGSEFRRPSDNGSGGDTKTHTLTVPLVQGTLPVVFRVKFTATDTSQNETSGAIVEHTFSES